MENDRNRASGLFTRGNVVIIFALSCLWPATCTSASAGDERNTSRKKRSPGFQPIRTVYLEFTRSVRAVHALIIPRNARCTAQRSRVPGSSRCRSTRRWSVPWISNAPLWYLLARKICRYFATVDNLKKEKIMLLWSRFECREIHSVNRLRTFFLAESHDLEDRSLVSSFFYGDLSISIFGLLSAWLFFRRSVEPRILESSERFQTSLGNIEKFCSWLDLLLLNIEISSSQWFLKTCCTTFSLSQFHWTLNVRIAKPKQF